MLQLAKDNFQMSKKLNDKYSDYSLNNHLKDYKKAQYFNEIIVNFH